MQDIKFKTIPYNKPMDKDLVDKAFYTHSEMARVDDRGLEDCQELGHFNLNDIPKGARVLNIGSGFQQKFEKEVHLVRPDIRIVSVDPTLAMLGYKVVLGSSRSDRYHLRTSEDAKERRKNLYNKGNSVATIGQALPFKDESFDFGIDIYGAAKYALDEASYRDYLEEIKRVVSGKFHIAEVFNGNTARQTQAMRTFDSLGIKATLFKNNIGKIHVNSEVFDDIRIGAILDLD